MARKQVRAREQESIPRAQTSPTPSSIPPILSRYAVWISLALIAIGAVRIVSTYSVFNHTIDEPAHVACGMEWLDKHTYTLEPMHPPLARVMAAIGPFFAGERSHSRGDIYNEGAAILYSDGHYDRNLTLARLGILPFFCLAAAVVFQWTRSHFGGAAAVVATFLFTMTPPVLAHAGLATTDMALTALFIGAFWILLRWVELPTWPRTALLGLCGGLAILSKLSSLPFLAACTAILFAVQWIYRRDWFRPAALRLAQLAASVLIALLVIWAMFGFSVGKEPSHGWTVPAPQFFAGLAQAAGHNTMGHPSYLLGQHSMSGFWNYYLVVLAVKTPIPLLLLAAIGAWLAIRARRTDARMLWPLILSAGVFIAAQLGSIQIGVRHILPVYAGFSILGAVAVMYLVERAAILKWTGIATGAALLWMLATSVASHPDYLPYFNFIAGDQPEKILADSDLDWGQDMKRLSARLRELRAPYVVFDPFIVAYLERVHGFPPIQPDAPDIPAPGYHAVSLSVLKVVRMGLGQNNPEFIPWPERMRPMERVGKGTLLFYINPPHSHHSLVVSKSSAPAT